MEEEKIMMFRIASESWRSYKDLINFWQAVTTDDSGYWLFLISEVSQNLEHYLGHRLASAVTTPVPTGSS